MKIISQADLRNRGPLALDQIKPQTDARTGSVGVKDCSIIEWNPLLAEPVIQTRSKYYNKFLYCLEGCCWALVATSAVEALYKIRNPQRAKIIVSPQELINCVEEDPIPQKIDKFNCYMSSYHKAFKWMSENGIAVESEVEFRGWRNPCLPKNKPKESLWIRSYKKINKGDVLQLLRRVARQPVAAAIPLSDELRNFEDKTGLRNLKEEIFEGGQPWQDKNGKALLHAVLIVGYDTWQGRNIWLVRNTWGKGWGDQGYFKVLRDSSLAKGQQSILSHFAYPEI